MIKPTYRNTVLVQEDIVYNSVLLPDITGRYTGCISIASFQIPLAPFVIKRPFLQSTAPEVTYDLIAQKLH